MFRTIITTALILAGPAAMASAPRPTVDTISQTEGRQIVNDGIFINKLAETNPALKAKYAEDLAILDADRGAYSYASRKSASDEAMARYLPRRERVLKAYGVTQAYPACGPFPVPCAK